MVDSQVQVILSLLVRKGECCAISVERLWNQYANEWLSLVCNRILRFLRGVSISLVVVGSNLVAGSRLMWVDIDYRR